MVVPLPAIRAGHTTNSLPVDYPNRDLTPGIERDSVIRVSVMAQSFHCCNTFFTHATLGQES